MKTTVFNYENYRTYLSDWFTEKKTVCKTFSYASFAVKAGFSDRGFINNVIHGRRDLTKESLIKIAVAIGLSKAESEYFENLVFFNKSTDLRERNFFYDKMRSVKTLGKAAWEATRIRDEQYEFYATWYHCVIRSLIDMYPFKNDFKWLARSVYPPITVQDAKKSVELLEHLGLIERKSNGNYVVVNKIITTGNEIKNLAVQNFHKMAADKAKMAIEILPAGKRNITGLTMGISEKTYHQICDEIQIFRTKIMAIVENDEDADRTYQLNFHLFPFTRTDLKTREGV